jgi:uncharacterized pyridoxamine 5'-phosphate oxidase family protein
MTKEDVLTFIKTKKHTVISTCGKNHQPEAAVIGFGETDEFELIFGTYRTSKKYKNLKENNKVAFVIGWDEDFITVQYEGIATELEPSETERYTSLFFKKLPSAESYSSHPDQTFWKVKPVWFRYSDLSEDEEKIFEYTM